MQTFSFLSALTEEHVLIFFHSASSQVHELTEQLNAVQTQRDILLSDQTRSLEEAQQLREALQATCEEMLKIRTDLGVATLREEELSRQFEEATQQLESLHSDQERRDADKSRLSAAVEENVLKVS